MREINVDFFEEVFRRVIDKLRFEVDNMIKLETDFYCQIPTSQWSDHDYKVDTGSLYDDIDKLRLLVEDKERICTYVDFDRLASLLRAVSEAQNPVPNDNADEE